MRKVLRFAAIAGGGSFALDRFSARREARGRKPGSRAARRKIQETEEAKKPKNTHKTTHPQNNKGKPR